MCVKFVFVFVYMDLLLGKKKKNPASLFKHKNRTGCRKCLVLSYFLAYGNETKAIVLHRHALTIQALASTWDKSALFAVMKVREYILRGLRKFMFFIGLHPVRRLKQPVIFAIPPLL